MRNGFGNCGCGRGRNLGNNRSGQGNQRFERGLGQGQGMTNWQEPSDNQTNNRQPGQGGFMSNWLGNLGFGRGRNRSGRSQGNQRLERDFGQGQDLANRQGLPDNQEYLGQPEQGWRRFLRLRRRDGSCMRNTRQGD